MQRQSIIFRPVHGVLLLDKASGCSSNHVMQKVKRIYRAEKAGHTGTLDPLATGLLPICFGAATKFSQIGLNADKRYIAEITLGVTTTTADSEGEILVRREVSVNEEKIYSACQSLMGNISQVPPMFSALKKNGKPLYQYARAGIELERETRAVNIKNIDIIKWQDNVIVIDIKCSKGTYVRVLAEDLGNLLGCGAHLSNLRRTESGFLGLDHAFKLESLIEMSEAERDAALMASDTLLSDWPIIQLNETEAQFFMVGRRNKTMRSNIDNVRIYGPRPHDFLGIARVESGEIISTRVLSNFEASCLIKPVCN